MKRDDNYYTIFMGAKLNKLQANRVGVGIFFAFIGIGLTLLLPHKEYNYLNYARKRGQIFNLDK